MSDQGKQELIIVRRYEAEEEQHKGGVWKIAHADFMTAMMAFFLVMWLISVADKETRTSVANYFNPVQLAESTPDRKGLQDPQNNAPESEDEIKKGASSKGEGEDKGGTAPQTQKPRFEEGALFQDPYAVLAKLALEAEQDRPQDTLGADVATGDSTEPGVQGGEAYRDPFDPLYWQIAPMPKPRAAKPGDPGTTTPIPPDGKLDALARSSQNLAASQKDEAKPNLAGPAEASVVQPAPNDGAPSSQESIQDVELKADIARAVQVNPGSGPKPHVEVNRTGEGLLISVTDEIDFSMFAIGSAEPQPKVVVAMAKIAKVLSSRQGKIIIRGHTDGRPFKSATYDNWRLSTARAHMASYMLVRGGIDEARIERVEGHADRSLKNSTDPKAAENRRIEILLREKS
ncbi:MotB family protein [Microvirga lenta]|uniref:MotB family protein n=1 Tax=Microvirga lenta TaxID=2881337 RepID=UPI001CFFB28A|nr:MotB family protein [Microvirga lenta]MCB5177753.1 MotB family protein [Microvirga lenta]